jgi:hypothetical protein
VFQQPSQYLKILGYAVFEQNIVLRHTLSPKIVKNPGNLHNLCRTWRVLVVMANGKVSGSQVKSTWKSKRWHVTLSYRVNRLRYRGIMLPNRMSPDRMSPDRMLPNRMSPDRMSPDRMSPNRMSPNRMSPDWMLLSQYPTRCCPTEHRLTQCRPTERRLTQCCLRQNVAYGGMSPTAECRLRWNVPFYNIKPP